MIYFTILANNMKNATSIPGPFLKLGKGKGPGIGWSQDTQNIWV